MKTQIVIVFTDRKWSCHIISYHIFVFLMYITNRYLLNNKQWRHLSKFVNKLVGCLNINLCKPKNLLFQNVLQKYYNIQLIKWFLNHSQRVYTTKHYIAWTVKIQRICIISFDVLCLFALFSKYIRSDTFDSFFICCRHLRCPTNCLCS